MRKLEDAVYAGVLGKIIGVYFGRPVEGWSYARIREQFGQIRTYVHSQVGSSIIEVDDDISGTFTFVKALRENGMPSSLESRQIGLHWLNKVIEEKTIFWWGGLFRSTEHTAYLRLKEGIDAPDSGSMAYNGKTVAEQIGSQIFIDGWGLINLGHPEMALAMAAEAAKVSHDGIAVSMAAWIAVLEAVVFEEKDIRQAMRQANTIVNDPEVSELVEWMINVCEESTHWRQARDQIEACHPYSRYGGNCPIVTNFLVIVMSCILDHDDFLEAISIATSAGYDTDCNAGNVGCIEAIRLGLENLDRHAFLRSQVNERMWVVSAEGGATIENASTVAQQLITDAQQLHEKTQSLWPRYAFLFPGCTHGFEAFQGTTVNRVPGIELIPQAGKMMEWRTEVFYDLLHEKAGGYALVASPLLYWGQRIYGEVQSGGLTEVTLFVDFFNAEEQVERFQSDLILIDGKQSLNWPLPPGRGYPIWRMGLLVKGQPLFVHHLDHDGEPALTYTEISTMSPNYTTGRAVPSWYRAFTDSTRCSTVDHLSTFCLSHTEDNGLVYIGNQDWHHLSIASTLILTLQKTAGLVLRLTGLQRYYAAVLQDQKLRIVCRKDRDVQILAECDFAYAADQEVAMKFEAFSDQLKVSMDGEVCLICHDSTYSCGAAGFLVEKGTVQARGLSLQEVTHA